MGKLVPISTNVPISPSTGAIVEPHCFIDLLFLGNMDAVHQAYH